MVNQLNEKVIRILLEDKVIADREELKNPEILNFIKHEFRFLFYHDDFVVRENALFAFFKKNHINLDKKTILDIGCGDCFNMVMLKKLYNADVIGIDIQKNSLIAKKIIKELFDMDLDVRLANNDFKSMVEGLNSRRFDVVFLLDLVEHLDNPQSYLINLKKILKDDAYLLVLFPPYYSAYGGHYSSPYLQYIPAFIRNRICYDPFKSRDYRLNRLTVSKFESYIKNEYKIIDKKMTFMSSVIDNSVLDFISKIPYFKEILFSWVYILQKI